MIILECIKTTYACWAEYFSKPKNEAATKIQKVFRGYRARAIAGHLPDGANLRAKVQTYLGKQESMEDAPRAAGGNTAVYLPPEFPGIVLKHSGRACASRLEQMAAGRKVCRQIGAKSLVIPKACLLQGKSSKDSYLIEQRLPINIDKMHQQHLYLTHLKEATPAIREFTHFILRTGIDDLLIAWQLFTLGQYDAEVRYDNFPFFLDNKGQVKIGLIDLEYLKINEKVKKSKARRLLGQIIYMYPYHMKEILEVGRHYLPEKKLKGLESSAEKGKRFLKISYYDLVDYMKTPKSSIKLEERVREQIIEEMKREKKLSVRECMVVDRLLTNYVDRFDRIMQNANKRPPYYNFDPGDYHLNVNYAEYHKLNKRLHFINPNNGYEDSDGLEKYLIQKLIDHKIIYRYVEFGMYGTMIA